MKCEFDEKIDKMIDDELSPEVESSLRIHIASCESCRQRYKSIVFGSEAIKSLFEIEGKTIGIQSVAAGVMARIGQSKIVPWYKSHAIAIAAGIALIFIVVGIFTADNRKQTPVAVAPVSPKSNVLVVKIQPERFNVEDKLGEITRKVVVKP